MATLPTSYKFVTPKVIEIYQTVVDQLIKDFGIDITLNLPPVKTGCPNCFQVRVGRNLKSTGKYNSANANPVGGSLHKVFSSGICPVCRGAGTIQTSQSVTVTATVNWKPKDMENDADGRNLNDVCKLKTLIVQDDINVELQMKRAVDATIDGSRCSLFKGPTQRGIRERRYITTYWAKTDNA